MKKYSSVEFYSIIEPVLENEEFLKTKCITHHGISRYEHCIRVAYYSYIITKFLRLDYNEVAIAAVLHDFFTDEVEHKSFYGKLSLHPKIALENARRNFSLSLMQEDIIKTHMFPVTFTPPMYIESFIVDLVDDVAAVYEKVYSVRKELNAAFTFLILLLVNYIK